MVKAATDWLFDQLVNHPDFWIPPVKELRYLYLPVPLLDNTLRKLAIYRPPRGVLPAADRNLAFLQDASLLAGKPRDYEKYAALFRFKGCQISGDISPGYYDLEGPVIHDIARQFPRLRIVLMVREPFERVWSHLSMRHREGHFDATLFGDVRAFSEWFAASEVRRACFATHVAGNWKVHAPDIKFRHFFFDDVEAAPHRVRADIVTYLGGNPARKSGKLHAGHNRKAGIAKLTMPGKIKTFLLDELAEEILACADMFGGPASAWPRRYSL